MKTSADLTRKHRVSNVSVDAQRPINGHMIVARCRRGEWLVQDYNGIKSKFSLQPSGICVCAHHARAAITSGKLLSLNDGLFKFSTQTWIAKERR